MFRHSMLLVLVTVLSCADAPPPDAFFKARFGSQEGLATLDTDRFIVIFESVLLDERYPAGGEWDLKVAGRENAGQSRKYASTKPHGVSLNTQYREGLSTITVDRVPGFRMEVREGGRTAEVSGVTIDLDKRKWRIVVHEDGTVTVS